MRRQLRIPASSVDWDTIRLSGGLDLVTPALIVRAGYVRDALNFEEAVSGGYARVFGYERTDGRPWPSNAVYTTLLANVTGALAVGNTITGATSAATGIVISITAVTGGSVIAHTKSTGTFSVGENLNVGGTPRATVIELGGAGTAASYDAVQRALAADVYRADIAPPAGSGAVRGGFYYNGTNYCFRDNAGATALILFKESAAGWVVVPFLNEVSFTLGTAEYAAGSTITQGANSATVRAVSLQSGSWAGGTAAGRLIITTPAPGSFAAGAAAGGGAVTLSGAQTAIVLLPGGRVQTDQGTLVATKKVYGCDGVNRCWEFDGTTLAPITTGAAADMPTCILVHKRHLWLALGPLLKNSAIANGTFGAPFNWTAAGGGSDNPAAGTINVLMRLPGQQLTGAMAVLSDEATEIMYGTSSADFQLMPFEESSGARKYGGQRLGGQAMAFGDLGVFSLTATQAFGNFLPSTLTMNIRPFTEVRRTQCTASLVHRSKSQYRLFFNDGYGLYGTIVNGRLRGWMPVFFANKAVCAWQSRASDGNETSFFGSDNGMVYRLDAGTSQDGANLDAFIAFVFNSQRNPRVEKAYTGGSFEVQGEGYGEFDLTYELGYGTTDRIQGVTPGRAIVDLGSAYWDTGLDYDSATSWDGSTLKPIEIPLGGTGVNIAMRIDSAGSAAWSSFTINSIVLTYLLRKTRKH